MLLREERDAWGKRSAVSVAAQSETGKLHSAVFSARELESVCGITGESEVQEVITSVLGALKRVARTFVLKPRPPAMSAEEMQGLGLDDAFGFQAASSSSSGAAFWVERFTPEGDVYYEDVSSGRTTWTRPPEFELLPPDLRRTKTKNKHKDQRPASEKATMLLEAFRAAWEYGSEESFRKVVPQDMLQDYLGTEV